MTTTPTPMDRPGITLTREQLEAWCCMTLTDEQVERLEQVLPDSSVPEAIQTIVESFEEANEDDLPLILAMDDDYCPKSEDNKHQFGEDRSCDLCGANEEAL
jgi:hypothetical protein